MKLKNVITISCIFFGLVPLLLVAYLSYNNYRLNLINNLESNLNSLADIKAVDIDKLFLRYKEEVTIMEDYFNVRSNLPLLINNEDFPNSPIFQKATKTLNDQLKSWVINRPDVDDVILVDLNGKIVYSANPNNYANNFGKSLSANHDPKAFANGLKNVYISDLFRDAAEGNKVYFLVTAPVHDLSNKLIGEIVLEINTNDLYEITNTSIGLGKTGELIVSTFCQERSNLCQDAPASFQSNFILFLNPTRFSSSSPSQETILPGSQLGIPTQKAISGNSGSGISTDYRNKQVFAVWRNITDHHWGLVIKQDIDEITLPAQTQAKTTLVIVIIAIFFLAFSIRIFLSISFRPLESLEEVSNKMSAGDLNVSIDPNILNSNDEIGNLARAMNSLFVNLRNLYASLEQKIRDRTSELEAAKAKNEAILSSIGDGLIATDELGNIIFLNQSGQKMLKISESPFGKQLVDLVPIQMEDGSFIDPQNRPMNIVLSSQLPFSSSIPNSFYYVRSDGTRFPVSIIVTPIIFNNKLIGTIEAFRDITIEKDIDKAKTEFISFASHQLRTPLTAIKWYTELLLEGPEDTSSSTKKYLDAVNTSNNRMIELVNSLLDISRIELGTFTSEPVPTNIADMARSVIQEQGPEISGKKIIFNESISEDIPLVNLDPKFLRMIFQNLLSNAIKYTPPMGSVTLKVSLANDKQNFLILVSDSGYGIPKDQQDHIFSKLFRADNIQKLQIEGTGLGLYIIKQIVDFSGGNIWFDSKENIGTTFYVSLPVKGMPKKSGTKNLL